MLAMASRAAKDSVNRCLIGFSVKVSGAAALALLFGLDLLKVALGDGNRGFLVISGHAGQGKAQQENPKGVALRCATLIGAEVFKVLGILGPAGGKLRAGRGAIDSFTHIGGRDFFGLFGAGRDGQNGSKNSQVFHVIPSVRQAKYHRRVNGDKGQRSFFLIF